MMRSQRISFRGKLVSISVAVLICYHLLVVLFNILFLEPYYLHRVETSLVNAFKVLSQLEELDEETISMLEADNLAIVIAERSDMTIVYNSMTPDRQMNDIMGRIMPGIEETAERTSTSYFVNTDELMRPASNGGPRGGPEGGPGGTIRRVMLGGISDRYLFDISTSYASIDQAISVSMQFSMIVGLMLIVIGIFAYSKVATMVTKPVIQITGVADKIAHLDFSEECELGSNDEIGELAQSVNTMSDFMQSHIQQLEDANQQLKADIAYRQEQNAARINLLANLSHDLKTPIGLISGYADGLRQGMAHTEQDVHEYCDVIVDESERMMNLIVRMMELFRLESGSVELQPEEFDLADLLNYVVEIFELEFEKSGLQFTADYGDCLYVTEDYFSVETVVTNYMQNAVSHVGSGGILRLSVQDTGKTYRVSLYNSSAPIDEDELLHMWDSFYRGDKSRTRSRRESGLGLSIVRSNMELIGGAYGAENSEGGVTFWAEFAKSPDPADINEPVTEA